MGHTTASYTDTLFLGHLWGGLQFAMGRTATSALHSGQAPGGAPKSGMRIRIGPSAFASSVLPYRIGNLRIYQPSGRETMPGAKADGIDLFLAR